MIDVTDQQFDRLIAEALDSLPGEHIKQIQNVVITMQDEPTEDQRVQLALRDNESLFGLYEGVPLAKRQGIEPQLPDKITLFKLPLAAHVSSLDQLREEIRHTIWHEVGHYYGLDHDQIYALEK